jgi:hypothetical protein
MKNYQQFTKGLNEGFIKDVFKNVGSFIMGDKKKISDNVSRMIEIEKDFIDKSDELNYNLFLSDARKSTDPVVSTALKQKSLMNKRAVDALKISKNSEIQMLADQIKRLVKNNPGLLNFYQKEKSYGDSQIAKYAYEKAKRFKDAEYENEFYNQWKNLDRETKTYSSAFTKTFNNGIDSFMEDDDLLSDLGAFDKPIGMFKREIESLPKNDVLFMLNDAKKIKIGLEARIQDFSLEIKNIRPNKYGADIASTQQAKEKLEEFILEYRKAIIVLDNKISLLKNRLKKA